MRRNFGMKNQSKNLNKEDQIIAMKPISINWVPSKLATATAEL